MTQIKQPLLLDSHIFIWALEQVEKLGQITQQLIQSGATVYVSKTSLWELAIKHKAKKLPYDTNYLLGGLTKSGFSLLDIDTSHLQAYPGIEVNDNKDPFDLLLIAQSVIEQCIFITANGKILESSYKVQDAKK
jgi:PIN domain nuclease of toxin-antitoxin system